MAAPTFDAVSSRVVTALGIITWNHVVGATADLILVGVASRGSKTVNTVDFNGSALTRVLQRDDGSGNCCIELWRLISPAVGTHAVTVTLADLSEVSGIGGAITLIGTNTTTPVSASASNGDTSGSSASLTATVASSTGELVVGIGMQTADDTFTSTGTGQTERIDVNDNSSLGFTLATQTGAASTVHSYTASGTKEWAEIVASIAAAGGGGGKASKNVAGHITKGLLIGQGYQLINV